MKQKVYAAYHKEHAVIEKSSSGGMFIALSDYIFAQGGIVIGAGYDYQTNSVKHIACTTPEERDNCCGSKYIQSFVSKEIYKKVETTLLQGSAVLYTGTPCQTSAMRHYLENKKIDTKDFYTCELLCHGVGNPGIWHQFISDLKRKKHTHITNLTFKDKRKGWMNPRCIASNGLREYSLRGYSWLYFSNDIMRPSCHKCRFSTLKRESDVTIGDYWGASQVTPSIYNERGTSFLLVNTEKGMALFQGIQEHITYLPIDLEACMQPNMLRPTPIGKNHKKVMHDYATLKTAYFFQKWLLVLGINKLVKRVFNR